MENKQYLKARDMLESSEKELLNLSYALGEYFFFRRGSLAKVTQIIENLIQSLNNLATYIKEIK